MLHSLMQFYVDTNPNPNDNLTYARFYSTTEYRYYKLTKNICSPSYMYNIKVCIEHTENCLSYKKKKLQVKKANHVFFPQFFTVIGFPGRNVFLQAINRDWKTWFRWWSCNGWFVDASILWILSKHRCSFQHIQHIWRYHWNTTQTWYADMHHFRFLFSKFLLFVYQTKNFYFKINPSDFYNSNELWK